MKKWWLVFLLLFILCACAFNPAKDIPAVGLDRVKQSVCPADKCEKIDLGPTTKPMPDPKGLGAKAGWCVEMFYNLKGAAQRHSSVILLQNGDDVTKNESWMVFPAVYDSDCSMVDAPK